MEAFGKKAGQLTRGMIPSGKFTVEIRFPKFHSEEEVKDVCNSLLLLGTVGGLGSKSRKGFGSLTITALKVDGKLKEFPDQPDDRLSQMFSKMDKSLPDWTAWSRLSRLVLAELPSSQQAVEVLDAIGREEVHFRSWGKNGYVLNEPSEKNFPEDHDLHEGKNVGIEYPFRVAFGLPHNYGKGKQHEVTGKNHDRRASPLFVHIHQTSEGAKPIGVVVFLPARFLPEGESIRAFENLASVNTNKEFWFPIQAFLDRLLANGKPPQSRPGYERFPEKATWWERKTALIAKEVTLG